MCMCMPMCMCICSLVSLLWLTFLFLIFRHMRCNRAFLQTDNHSIRLTYALKLEFIDLVLMLLFMLGSKCDCKNTIQQQKHHLIGVASATQKATIPLLCGRFVKCDCKKTQHCYTHTSHTHACRHTHSCQKRHHVVMPCIGEV